MKVTKIFPVSKLLFVPLGKRKTPDRHFLPNYLKIIKLSVFKEIYYKMRD